MPRLLFLLAVSSLLIAQETPIPEDSRTDNNPANQESLAPSIEDGSASAPTAGTGDEQAECCGDIEGNQIAREANAIARADLQQQTAMADRTADIAQYTGWQLAIGVLGLILLGFTLLYTKNAAKHTGDSLKIAQSMLEKDRPIVVIEIESSQLTGNRGGYIRLKVKNYGEIPAQSLQFGMDIRLVGDAQEIPEIEENGFYFDNSIKKTLGKGDDFLKQGTITITELLAAHSTTQFLWVTASCKYSSILHSENFYRYDIKYRINLGLGTSLTPMLHSVTETKGKD